jgi:PAS domain S-box-containing protein
MVVPTAPVLRIRTARVLVLGLVIMDLAVVAAAWRMLALERTDKFAESTRHARNLAHVIGENLEGTIHLVDLTLEDAIGDIAEQQAAPAGTAAATLDRHLNRLNAQVGFTDGIRIADAQGRVVHGTIVPKGAPVDVSDRSYFIQARDGSADRLVISEPVVSRITGERVLAFARRLTKPDGSFGGVVYAVVRVEQLGRALLRVNLGEDGAVVLRGRDHEIVARFPARTDGQPVVGNKRVTPQLARIVDSGVTETTFVAASPVDGVVKINAFRRLQGGEFYLLVAIPTEAFLAGWRAEALRTAGGTLLFLLLTGMAGLYALRSWKRETEARFRALVDGAPVAITVARSGRVLYVNQAFVRTLGLPSAEVAIGRSIVDSMTPDDAGRTAERWNRIGRKLPVDPVAEVTLRRPDGTSFRAAITDAAVELEDGPALIGFVQDVTERKRFDEERERLIGELKAALADVKTLSGLLPICAHCKKVRDDRGYWSRIETYIRERSHAEFTHGICPDCARQFFPEGEEPGGGEPR